VTAKNKNKHNLINVHLIKTDVYTKHQYMYIFKNVNAVKQHLNEDFN